MGIGVPELLIVLAILLLVFGPKRLPHLGRQLGGGMREFKDSITGKTTAEEDDDASASTVAQQAGLPSAPAPVAPTAPPAPETVTAEPVDADPAAPPRQ
jgi:sec-independent protein translocase protein TatA